MHLTRIKDYVFAAMLAAASVVILILGSLVLTRATFFCIALASYLIGICANKCGFLIATIQLSSVTVLDVLLNPDKVQWITYLLFGIYIILVELTFKKWNKETEKKKKLFSQYFINFILFNILFVPCVIFFFDIMFGDSFSVGVFDVGSYQGRMLLWFIAQVVWLIYDLGYKAATRYLYDKRIIK